MGESVPDGGLGVGEESLRSWDESSGRGGKRGGLEVLRVLGSGAE